MSEGDAQITVSPGASRLGELNRTVTRTPRGPVDAASTGTAPSFADSLFTASQFLGDDGPGADAGEGQEAGTGTGESEAARSARKPGASSASSAARTDQDQTDSSLLALTLDPETANAAALQAAAAQIAAGRAQTVSAIRPEGRSLGPVPAAGSAGTTATANPALLPGPSSAQASAAASQPAGATAVQAGTVSTQAQAATQAEAASAAAAANQAAAAAQQAEVARAAAARQAMTAGAASTTTATATATATTTPASANPTASTAAVQTSAQAAQASQYAAASRAYTAAPSSAADAAGLPAVQAAIPLAATAARSGSGTASTAGAYVAGSGGTIDVGGSGGASRGNGTGSAGTSSSTGASSDSLKLSQYPKPARSNRTGVLNWVSDTPPEGKELDRLISEARDRKAGWVTFVANPDRTEEYDDFMDRLTKAGIQPIARIEDPYGDLPPEDVTALVKDLRGNGVTYFELFDGPNVATETPDDKVDVKDYADRWLAAAKAVVAEGGLPGIGALAPRGDYDEHGFMRQFLSAVKERDGGTDVLGQSWLALRGDQPGATASSDDTDRLADRATWFDRVSRQSLGRSMPILATQDPSGPAERLTGDSGGNPGDSGGNPGGGTQADQIEQADRTLHDRQRKLPALFGASRGTLDHAQP
jgi:hypothetical protein